jgi:glycosyltransferase involved in cell wall biosynthesis
VRIAWVVIGALEQATGGYIYDQRVVSGLRALGHHVEVVSLGQARVHEGPALSWRLLREPWDVVVADELCHPAVAVAFGGLAAVRARPRRLLLVHHLAEWEDGQSRATEWACVRLAHHVVTTSVTSRERLRRTLGVDATACLPGADRFELRPRTPTVRETTELLFVGTVTLRKQLHVLVEALGRVPRDDYRLTIVGDDSRDADYVARVKASLSAHPRVLARTSWLGEVGEGRLAEVYARSDILVSVSSFEGYGMALAEAVRAGLGVVSTRVGAVSEVLVGGQEALLVPLGDTAALVRALERVIGDRFLREHMQRCAAQREFQRWNDTTERFARCLNDLLAEGSEGTR